MRRQQFEASHGLLQTEVQDRKASIDKRHPGISRRTVSEPGSSSKNARTADESKIFCTSRSLRFFHLSFLPAVGQELVDDRGPRPNVFCHEPLGFGESLVASLYA